MSMKNEVLSKNLWDILSRDYKAILESGDFSDVIITVGRGSNMKEFRGHSLVLKTRSSYFRIALSRDWAQMSPEGMIKFTKPNIEPEIFEAIFKYIYSGTIDLGSFSVPDILELLIAADELSFIELCDCIQEFLVTSQDLVKQYIVFAATTAQKYSPFGKLGSLCKKILEQTPTVYFHSRDFTTAPPELLSLLFKKHPNALKETEFWEKLIEWGRAQAPSLPIDVSKWTEYDFSTFGDLVNPYICYIKFNRMSPDEFFEVIHPFRQIFDNDFYEQLLEYHASAQKRHPHYPEIDSNLITRRHAALISEWINESKTDINDTDAAGTSDRDNSNCEYEYNLLTRGSRDGFTAKIFHNHCDLKGPTITLIRVKDTNEILGGYNPLDWKPGSCNDIARTRESFIFALDYEDMDKSILSRVVDNGNAIFQLNRCGPHFGNQIRPDLGIMGIFNNADEGQCNKFKYRKRIRKTNGKFQVGEYEVFQVVRKK
ncbi:9673_t:CDS:2 [Acaulospora colombiana]|uniref:9673_t:CDS:1 n=1 Tax=Acaulospora colombiana TaxID=27376 RepID=A0ACA9M5J9_9GLOM|nr:9673_t:CDS:2 [Acaulospora colombiana]